MILVIYCGNENIYPIRRIKEEVVKKNLENIFKFKNIVTFNFLEDSLRKEDYEMIYVHNTGDFLHYLRYVIQDYDGKIVDRFYKKGVLMSKTLSYRLAKKVGLLVPKSLKFNICSKNIPESIKKSIGFPVVVKDDFKHRGRGVILIRNERELINYLNKNWDKIHRKIFQEFINYDKDFRVFVVGSEVVCCMERISLGKDFRANISLGGVGKFVKLESDILESCIKLCERIG